MKVAYWVVSSILIFLSSVALGQGTDSSKLIPSTLVPVKRSFLQGSQAITFFPHIKQCISETSITLCPDGYSPKAVVSIRNIPQGGSSPVKAVKVEEEAYAQPKGKTYQIIFASCGNLTAYPRTVFQDNSEGAITLTAMIFCVPS